MRIPLAVSVAVLALACACSSPPKDAAGGRIMVVDAHGASWLRPRSRRPGALPTGQRNSRRRPLTRRG